MKDIVVKKENRLLLFKLYRCFVNKESVLKQQLSDESISYLQSITKILIINFKESELDFKFTKKGFLLISKLYYEFFQENTIR